VSTPRGILFSYFGQEDSTPYPSKSNMRTLFFNITLLILVVGAAASVEDGGKKPLFSTWAPWFSHEESEDTTNTKKKPATTMTSKRRKDTEDKPKAISFKKKMKKINDPKTIDGGK
jgi:hypothetical protein